MSTWTNILDLVYPVGSMYFSTSSTSPATLFGGTWTQVTSRFIIAADGSTYKSKATGGSFTHNHDLGTCRAAIGATDGDIHSISYSADTVGDYYKSVGSFTAYGLSVTTSTRSFNHHTPVYGSTKNVTSIPEWLAAYIWYRTA